jgi:hypothetical protein
VKCYYKLGKTLYFRMRIRGTAGSAVGAIGVTLPLVPVVYDGASGRAPSFLQLVGGVNTFKFIRASAANFAGEDRRVDTIDRSLMFKR